jgi:hypothetical protein
MSDWLRIGSRYINLSTVCEVRFDERSRTVHVFLVSGGTIELRDEDAADLLAVLARVAPSTEEPHRTVFAMPSS